jgi:hypothetical protein
MYDISGSPKLVLEFYRTKKSKHSPDYASLFLVKQKIKGTMDCPEDDA